MYFNVSEDMSMFAVTLQWTSPIPRSTSASTDHSQHCATNDPLAIIVTSTSVVGISHIRATGHCTTTAYTLYLQLLYCIYCCMYVAYTVAVANYRLPYMNSGVLIRRVFAQTCTCASTPIRQRHGGGKHVMCDGRRQL